MRPTGGGPLEGIVVTIAETGATATVDAHGDFSFPAMVPGTYTLVASGNGYSNLKITDVAVAAGKTESITEEMPLAAAGGQQTVSAEGAAANSQGIQQLASFFVTAAPIKPFENGTNLDLPRTSNDVQPYTIINREAIDQSDYTSLSSFLENELTQDTTYEQFNQGPGGNTGNPVGGVAAGGHTAGIGSVNLRGLGTAQTLVLVDGARIASQQFDGIEIPFNLDQIPLSAIDHIEVLDSSGSAIYGSSAVGGVINIVLKKDYTGGEVDAAYGDTFHTDNSHKTIDFDDGFSIGKNTHVSIMAGYDEAKTPLLQNESYLVDRAEHVAATQPSLLEGTGVFTPGATPNILLDTAVVSGYTDASTKTLTLKNGTSLNSTETYIPPGTSPSTSAATLDAGLLADAGTQNFNLAESAYNGLEQQVEPFPRNESFMASIDHEFNDRLEAYADFGFNEMKLITFWNGGGGTNNGGVNQAVTVPGNAANNPFSDNIFMSIPIPPSQAQRVVNTNADRYGVLGLLFHLPAGWEAVAEYSLTEARYENLYQQLFMQNNSTDAMLGQGYQLITNGVFNPFVDTVQYPQNYASYEGTNYEWFPSELSDVNLRASGPVFDLPGGAPKLTIGVEDRADFIGQGLFLFTQPALPDTTQTTPFSYVRDIYPGSGALTQAFYLETEVPIISEKNDVPLVDSLEFEAAGRTEIFNTSTDPVYTPTTAPQLRAWDKYSSSNPTLGLKWNPIKSLVFRASYAAGFVPPTPAQLQDNTAAVPTTSAIFYDPKLNESYTTSTVSLGGNANLKPQTSKSYDVGAIWTPDSGPLEGLRTDLEFYEIHENNLIQSIGLQETVDTPGLQNYVIRDPSTGMITEVLLQDQNVAEEYTDGWDASIDYTKATSIGTFNLHAAATLTEHLKQPPAPGDPLVEYVGFVDSSGVDKLKANGTFTWLIGRNWTLGWNTIYYDSYKETGAPSDPEYGGASTYTPITTYLVPLGGDTIPSQMYHNIFASYRFGGSTVLHNLLSNTTLQVGINDVFNTAPPFDADAEGGGMMFYSSYGSPLLRNYVLKIKKEW